MIKVITNKKYKIIVLSIVLVFSVISCFIVHNKVYAEGTIVKNIISSKINLSQEEISLVSDIEMKFKLIRPLEGGYISCPFGGYDGHKGTDIATPIGTPIYASESGIITMTQKSNSSYGNCVLIDHENGIVTRYAHQSKFIVKEGQRVARGELIGYSGSTGNSTGPHLHFEVIVNGIPKNPCSIVAI